VSASVNLLLHHNVHKFSFWHRLTLVVPEKNGRKTVVVHGVVVVVLLYGMSHLAQMYARKDIYTDLGPRDEVTACS